jgi:glyoxylase-like metal-dependent hydrolase (beta-lactamase superfamily II)
MHTYICVTCGTSYPPSDAAPERCPICEDERQYVPPEGQQWTTWDAMHDGRYTNTFVPIAPGITAIRTTPAFAISQRAYLIQTPQGNVLWDCITYLDDATIAEIQARGGLAAIAISHPHFYSSMGKWSHAFGDIPIHLHAADQQWVMNPAPVIRHWEGETQEVLPGVRVMRCGGHFPGSSVLHWNDGAAIFTGDTIRVASDQRYVTFMYSYPNDIPLNAAAVEHIAATVAPLPFSHLYDGWRAVTGDAHAAVKVSAERYIQHVR